jgi:A/G-specific adenine glycosylase
VIPAWERFLERFPTVHALASSTPADVLRAWQGMGYDRRALNLRRAAIVVVDEHDGRVPDDLAALERLPGVGPYTARAVAAIAFGVAVGAVDTNVRRVLARALDAPAGAESARWIQTAADASVSSDRPGDWTHALMDIGATICRAAIADCAICPLRAWCGAAAAGRPTPRASEGRAKARRGSEPRPLFSTTRRWLRGRIVDRLRAVEGDAWLTVDAPIGAHDAAAVERALRALGRDGVIELHPTDPRRARLSVV